LGLIGAAAVIYIGVAVSTVRYMHQVYRSITMLRGGLVGLIFSKTLVLRDGVYDESAAVTHMSTDIDRIVASMQNMHEVWARLVEVAIGVWLLSIQIGAVSVIPIIVVVREFSPKSRCVRSHSLTCNLSMCCYQHPSLKVCEQETEGLERSCPDAYRRYCFHVRFNEECEDDGSCWLALSDYPKSSTQRDEVRKWIPMARSIDKHDGLHTADIRASPDFYRI